MKYKNGFTLVEVLGVIVVLMVIAMITVPLGLKYVSDGRFSAFKSSIENFTRVLRNENAIQDYQGVTYQFPLNQNIDLGIKGDTSTWIGEGSIDENGVITISIQSGPYCAHKTSAEEKITFEQNCKGL